MANIKQHLSNIKNALFGHEVRGSIHDGIDSINKEVESTTGRQQHLEGTFEQLIINEGNSNAEIVAGRVKEDGTQFPTIGKRIADSEGKISVLYSQYTGVITPKMFEGNDCEKIQSALDYCLLNQAKLVLDRLYDITGYTLKINKGETGTLSKRYPTYIEGGGIIKRDSGFIFSSDIVNTSDLYLSNMFFESEAGKGTIVYDLDKIIRLHSTNCQYSKVDTICDTIDADGYSQSIRFTGDTITGGKGYAFNFNGVYDTVLDGVTIEQRESGIRFNATGTHGATYGLTIMNSVLEGLYGSAVSLGSSFNTKILNCYFEANSVGNIITDNGAYLNNLLIQGCGLYGSVVDKCKSLVKVNGKAVRVNITDCTSNYGNVIDASGVTDGYIFYTRNRSYIEDVGEDHLIISDTMKYKKGNDINTSYLGQFMRIQKTITATVKTGINKVEFELNTPIPGDCIISPQVMDDRITGFNYYRKGTKVCVNVSCPESIVSMNVIIVLTVLKPYFSITG